MNSTGQINGRFCPFLGITYLQIVALLNLLLSGGERVVNDQIRVGCEQGLTSDAETL